MGLAEHYDHFAQEYLVDPFGLWEQLRQEEPVARSKVHGGYYIVSRYEDIRAAARDPERFSSTQSTGIPPLPIVGMIPIDIDPPDQREYRKILNPALNVDAVNKREPEIRQIVVDLIEPLQGRDEFDVGIELAPLVPPHGTLDFIGFPREDWDTIIHAVDAVTRLRGSAPEEVAEAGMALMGACVRLTEARRAGGPKGDLMDLILTGDFYDRKLEDQEIVRMLAILLFGAVDTTSLAISGTLHYLATHPEAQRHLRQNGVSTTAVEEMVRYTCPVQGLGRTVAQDTELHGCPLKQNDKVLLLWASGNREESVFENPDVMDFERKPNPHLGFGHGPHKCVGLNLGKLMLRVTMEEFLARIPEFELGDPDRVEWVGGETRGLRHVPIRVKGGASR